MAITSAKSIEDIPNVKRHFERKLAQKDTGFFAGLRKWNYKRQVNKFEKKSHYCITCSCN